MEPKYTEFSSMRSDRKDIRAYRGTIKIIRTMYLCNASTGTALQLDRQTIVMAQPYGTFSVW